MKAYDSTGMLLETRAAKDWNEAFPIGNGHLGAMCWGGCATERFDLNHDELWTGYPRDPFWNASYEALCAVKDRMREGDPHAAEEILERDFTGYSTEAYMQLGTLTVEHRLPQGRISGYTRTLTLRSALAEESFRVGGVSFHRSVFLSHPDGVMVLRYTASQPGALHFDFTLSSPLRSFTLVRDGVVTMDGDAPLNSSQNRERRGKERAAYYADDTSECGIRFRAGVTVAETDGTVLLYDRGKNPDFNQRIGVRGATEVTLLYTAETSFNGYRAHPVFEGRAYRAPVAERLRAAKEKGYAALLCDHLADFGTYFDRTSLTLGGNPKTALATSERLVRHKAGERDNSLYTLFFSFGKYLMISASREGTQPMNLQGIWSTGIVPPWNSNYTVNINTEMNDWPTLMLDLPEMQMPLVEMIRDISVTGRETARRLYRADGFVCHHNTDLWRLTVPVVGLPLWSFWTASGGWLCRHLYDRYLYTGDTAFLRETAYPIMREAARFYLSQLEEEKDGYLIYFPSTSPESRYVEHETGLRATVSATSTMTMAVIHELFSHILAAAEILRDGDALTRQIAKALPRLLPYRTERASGCLAEWYGDAEAEDPHHRHISALYPLHPGREITPDGTPELAEAARRLLERRGDMGTGWSVAWKINFRARLWDGDRALSLLDMQLSPADITAKGGMVGGGTYPNLLDAHPPFQIDGNFGAVSGILEMLVQSREDGTVLLLPALPGAWRSGRLTGVRLVGGGRLDLAWENGELSAWSIEGGSADAPVLYRGRDLRK